MILQQMIEIQPSSQFPENYMPEPIEEEKIEEEKNEEEVIKPRHRGIKCGQCGNQPIIGARLLCTACSQNFCETCFAQHDKNHHNYVFIAHPADQTQLNA